MVQSTMLAATPSNGGGNLPAHHKPDANIRAEASRKNTGMPAASRDVNKITFHASQPY